jgi:hypothetical protein
MDDEELAQAIAAEIVEYYAIFDWHDVWKRDGALALAKWLLTTGVRDRIRARLAESRPSDGPTEGWGPYAPGAGHTTLTAREKIVHPVD